MWVNIELVNCEEDIIYLPERIAERFNDEVKISFGKRTVSAKVEGDRSIELTGKSSFEKPVKIKLSDSAAENLKIYETLTYQIKFGSGITIGPVIGLLLGDQSYTYDPYHMEKYSDRFGVYDKVGGLIYAFSAQAIDWDKEEVYGLYYNYPKAEWEYGTFPLPSVIYRRDFHSKSENISKLEKLTNGKLFNSWRFTKYYLYEFAKKNRELVRHLPQTELCSDYEQIKTFIDKYGNVILKPISLSRGRGICIINKEEKGYRIFDYRNSGNIEKIIEDDSQLDAFFTDNTEFFNSYLIQRHLVLAKVKDSPFDIRIVMQKEKPLRWKCMGIECRVAAENSLLTNISRGGYALTMDQALKEAFPNRTRLQGKIKEQLDDLCHELCRSLDATGHHYAELGIDIAVDEDGNLWIIEVNVFPSFKGFKLMDYKTYLKIRYTPLIYAGHLAGF